MKHSRLHSVAHNFTASLASGLGFVVGYCPIDIFGDAAANGSPGLVVDFLTGRVFAKRCSLDLRLGMPLFQREFAGFCRKHGVSRQDYRLFRARFICKPLAELFIVTITDSSGKCTSREYAGSPGERVKVMDELGRLRPAVLRVPDAETLSR